jgi:hypothetical protein
MQNKEPPENRENIEHSLWQGCVRVMLSWWMMTWHDHAEVQA